MSAVSVLLVDDQELVRAGIATVLRHAAGIEVVGEAADGAEAVQLATALRPDVVLMDVRMPRMNGIDATRAIVGGPGGSRVIVLTTFDIDEYAFAALKAGASGFLLKDAPAADIVQAVQTVASGDAILSPRITKRMLDLYRDVLPEAVAEDPSSPVDDLTGREREVLLAVAEGLSNAEIGERLYLSESTIKTHVSHVLTKLGLRDRVQAVIYCYRVGLV